MRVADLWLFFFNQGPPVASVAAEADIVVLAKPDVTAIVALPDVTSIMALEDEELVGVP